jgi:small nuclear ribonucleoprotein (snRNP)-like protein
MKPGVGRAVVPALAVWLLSLPGLLLSQESHGANVIVTLKDGWQVSGELIAVKQDSLIVLSPSGKAESVEAAEVSTVMIRGKSNAVAGALIGFAVGAAAGIETLTRIDRWCYFPASGKRPDESHHRRPHLQRSR